MLFSLQDDSLEVCELLSSVSMPELQSLGKYAFQNAKALVNISLPKLTTLGPSAFQGVSALEKLSLPSITSIGGSNMFMGSKTGIEMTLPATPPTIAADTFQIYSIFPDGASIIVPASAVSTYESADDGGRDGWWGFAINPPTLVSTNPSDNAIDVDASADLVMTFSENVVAGTTTAAIYIKKSI